MITRLERIREYLGSEHTRLFRELETAGDQHYGDSFMRETAEVAMQALERNKQLVLRGHLRERILEVERALEKLDEGTYGLCDLCGQLIPSARLEAMPQAVLCVACKTVKGKEKQR